MSVLRSTYRRTRRALARALGRDVHFPVQVQVAVERHGSEYGGWCLCPRDLARNAVIYSLGIGTDISFDLSIIEKYGVTVHAFDPTPGSMAFVKAQKVPTEFRCHEIGVGPHDGTATFYPPVNPSHISHTLMPRAEMRGRAITVQIRRLSTIMRELGHASVDVLKMDIEGAEYDVLNEILERRLPVGQILVEFHHRFPGIGPDRTRRAIEELNTAGYRIFFVAENGEEYSLIRDAGN
jgi:FkbM family methyltransferase